MMISDAAIAFSILILAIAFWFGFRPFWLYFVVLAIRSAGSAVQSPALMALIPQFVPADRLTRVNSLLGSINSIIFLITPALGAVLYGNLPLQWIFLIDVGTATIAVLILAFIIKIPAHERSKSTQKPTYWADLLEGFRYIKAHRFVLQLFIFLALALIVSTPDAMLTPLQATRNFGPHVWILSAIEIGFSAGMLVGGLILAAWGGFRNKMVTICVSLGLMGLITIGIALTRQIWLYIGLMVLTGLALPYLLTPANVLLQQKVEEAFMGRVMSVYTMISSSVFPLTMLLVGPLADQIDINLIFLISGIAMLILPLSTILFPGFIKAGQPEDEIYAAETATLEAND